MYTLLLVDDEEEVTRIIAKKVKWNDLGFSVTGHANNGLKALEMWADKREVSGNKARFIYRLR